MIYNDADLDIMARTLYGEAEALNELDAIAIGWVIKNRVDYPNWPNSVREVCLQPWQFSCWNANDPNRDRILKGSGRWFDRCKELAKSILEDKVADPTFKSTHYYATFVAKPKWAKGHTCVYTTQHRNKNYCHLFFNDIDTAPPQSAREALNQIKPVSGSGTVKAARAGVVGTGAVVAASEIVNQVAPAMPIVKSLADKAPWAIVVILLCAIGYMVWRRVDDRNNGVR